MSETDHTDIDKAGSSSQHEPPGGSSSRGPEYGTPGEAQVPVPPYDEDRGEASAEGAEGVRKAFDASNAGAPGPGAPVTDEERSGMSATEMDPEGPLGVGVSRGGRAEDHAPDRDDVGGKGPADRPVGKTTEDDSMGDKDKRPTEPEMPDLQAGDQGG